VGKQKRKRNSRVRLSIAISSHYSGSCVVDRCAEQTQKLIEGEGRGEELLSHGRGSFTFNHFVARGHAKPQDMRMLRRI
jgi:hypothetical protein